jgi:hypothetical protein
MSLASDLTAEIWNAIADLIQRSQSPREIYFVKVKKVDKKAKLIWADDFGDLAIPLVSHDFSFSHFDTQPSGTLLKRQDTTQTNPAYRVEIVLPKVNQIVIVLDPWGAKRFPICIGTFQSKMNQGAWEET